METARRFASLPRRLALAVAALAATALLAAAGDAAPEPACDYRFEYQGSPGEPVPSWHDNRNWRGGQVPDPGSDVCIAAGMTVRHERGFAELRSLHGEGRLIVAGGMVSTTALSDLGRLEVAGGAAIVRFDGDAELGRLDVSNGFLGGTGTIATDDASWTGGWQVGTGATVVRPGGTGLEIAGGEHQIHDRTLRVEPAARAEWTAGNLVLGNGARLENAGSFEIAGDQDVSGCCGVGDLVNRPGGVLVKRAGDGETTIAYRFENDGEVRVDIGSLGLRGGGPAGGASDGSFELASGTTLELGSGRHALSPSSSVRGGAVRFTAGDTTVAGELSAPVTIDGAAARAHFQSDQDLPSLTLSSGVLSGPGTVATPTLRWAGGGQSGPGATEVPPGGDGLTIAGGPSILDDRVLRIAPGARARWEAGRIELGHAALIENQGTFEARASATLDGDERSGRVVNAAGGTFRSQAEGQATIAAPFTNEGTVEADAGTLALASGLTNFSAQTGTLSGGAYRVRATLSFLGADVAANSATVVLEGPGSRIVDPSGVDGLRRLGENRTGGRLTILDDRDLDLPGRFDNAGSVTIGRESSLASAGGYRQTGGSTTLAHASATLAPAEGGADVQGGSLSGVGTVAGDVRNAGEVRPGLSPGLLTITGRYVQQAEGALEIEVGGRTAGADHDRLDVGGPAELGGTLRVVTVPGFEPAPGDEFEIVRHGRRSGEFAALEGLEAGGVPIYAGPDYGDVATVLRHPPLPAVAIGDVEVREGDAGRIPARFALELASPRSRPVSIDYATADGTATAGADYDETRGTVTFSPGETSKPIEVPVAGDVADEPDETFSVALTGVRYGALGGSQAADGDLDASGTGKILDDDEPPPDPGPGPGPNPDPPSDPGPGPAPGPSPHPPPDSRPRPSPNPHTRPAPGGPGPVPSPGPPSDPGPGPAPGPSPDPPADSGPGPSRNPQTGPDPVDRPGPEAGDPTAPGGPEPPPTCVDRTAPVSRFDRGWHPVRATRRGLSVAGFAWDHSGCRGRPGVLSHVAVAIARREGGGTSLCRNLQASGRLGPVVSCRRPIYVRARGLPRWRLRARGPLLPGTYTARSRAFDRLGNFEKKLRRRNPMSRNFLTFRIR